MKNKLVVLVLSIVYSFFLFTSLGLAQDFWIPTSGPLGGTIYSLAANSQGRLFAGTDISGVVFSTTDKGTVWVAGDSGMQPYTYVSAIAVGDSDFIFAGYSGGIYRSKDNGTFWSQCLTTNVAVTVLYIDRSKNVFAGTQYGRVYRSSDNGTTWKWLDSAKIYQDIWCIVVNDSGHIFLGTESLFGGFMGGLYVSKDNGKNWVQNQNGYVKKTIRSLAINSQGYIFAGTNDAGVVRSTDNGNNWTTTMLLDTAIYSIVINSRGDLYAAAFNKGVYYSSNAGDLWYSKNTGLTNSSIHSLAINTDGYIYAGTENGGVYRSARSTTTAVEQKETLTPINFLLQQNYPNPFNPSTTISFELAKESFVTLKVFNLLGNEVAEVARGKFLAGKHSLAFDGSKLSTGVYFYRLEAGNFAATKKFVLLK